MKETVLFLSFLMIQSPAFANGTASSGTATSVTTQNFTGVALYSQPLTGYERCQGPNPAIVESELPASGREYSGTTAGREAYSEAASLAINICKQNRNYDCRVVSAEYKDVVSTLFIGFKGCQATVVVRGYKE